MKRDLATSLGWLIQQARKRRGWTVSELASASGVDFLAVKAVEEEGNLDRETLLRVSEALRDDVESGRDSFPCLRIEGGVTLSGTIEVKASKNASVALLCASLLNRGRTTIRNIAQIEEVSRIIEVLASIGVQVSWDSKARDVTLVPPNQLSLETMNVEAARRTRLRRPAPTSLHN